MITDLVDAAKLPITECDVCILGAGPAGISTALELARLRPDWQIALLEGGGRNMPASAELDPYAGESVGSPAYPLAGSRLRYLGGTSNHWGGWCRPLDAEDFEARSWIPHSGWPLTRDDLLPWYKKAAVWCEIASNEYSEAALSPSLGGAILPVDDSQMLCNKYFRFSPPTRFGTRYRADLDAASNLHLLLHANATGLTFSNQRVTSVQVAIPSGTTGTLKARQVVVALGGIETTRFLLMHAVRAPHGSGLASPMLGRCFADHFGVTPAVALLPEKLGYNRNQHPTGALMPVLSLTRAAQESLRVPDFCVTPVPDPQSSDLQPVYAENQTFGLHPGRYWKYRLQMILEPQPNPDSRITLIDQVDAFGMKRIHLDWKISEADLKSCVECLDDLGAELGLFGLGRLRILSESEYMGGMPGVGFHHMGSARMAGDVEGGVVDADCRVHGMENLHVASSAVFPSFGFSNPTLTIVALATKLAAHLAQSASPSPVGLH